MLTSVKIQFQVFWIVTPCSFVTGYQYFIGSCCLPVYADLDLNLHHRQCLKTRISFKDETFVTTTLHAASWFINKVICSTA